MALTLRCARCHDHKFDPISQREYYQFFGFFNQVPETGYHQEHVGNPKPVIPLPTAAQLHYQQQEIVALTHFNMATFYKDGDPACDATNWETSQLPSSFAPTNMNVSNWIESYKAVGAVSGILTAKHGCG